MWTLASRKLFGLSRSAMSATLMLLTHSSAGLVPGLRGSAGAGRLLTRRTVATATATVPLLPRLPAVSGPVAKGYQRGSAKLGFPTANLPCSLFQDALSDLETGVYLGWAGLGGEVHKCVCNVGFSPSFVGTENPEKILEAHIIADGQAVPADFYGEPLRVLLLGYIRPERRFDFSKGPGELIAAIGQDVATASAALDTPPMSEYKRAPWLVAAAEQPTFEMVDPSAVLRR